MFLSCSQSLHVKTCLSFFLDGSTLPKDLSRWLGSGVGNRRRSLNPRSWCCPPSLLSKLHRPRELLRSLDWFRRFSRCLSSSDNWFTSLETASTKSFVSSRLITATFGVCSSSSILVTASRCSASYKTVSIFIYLSPICFLRSNLTWIWLIPAKNLLRTRWSLLPCHSGGWAFKANCIKSPTKLSVFSWLLYAKKDQFFAIVFSKSFYAFITFFSCSLR